jgi:hypothetical protein
MNRFAFDANRHEYIDTDRGEILPHITGMLEQTGWKDGRWYTQQSRDRGTAVHRLTADYDLGAVEDINEVTSDYKGWLFGHVKGVKLVRPVWRSIEEALIHPVYRYGGRPDRVAEVYGAVSVIDIKSGAPGKDHPIQTALQAILVGHELNLPPESIQRYCWYLGQKTLRNRVTKERETVGTFKQEPYTDKRDFDEAYRIIRVCCEVAA